MPPLKLDILAIGVHPDDVELSACGTVLKHIDLGYKVGLLDLTKGELGTRGSAAIRTEEATEAARMLGVAVREQLDLQDGFFQHTEDNLLKIIRIIRKYQPEIVLANAIDDRHPDHARAAKLVADACFLAGLRKIETEGLQEWRPKNIYHYIQDRSLKADLVVDITPYISRKLEVIMAYKTQFYDPNSSEPMTPISSPEFLLALQGKDRVYGRLINVPYAEAFTSATPVGVKNLLDLQ